MATQTRHRAQVGSSNAQDNANAGVTSDVYIDGYTLAGTKLFRIDLGRTFAPRALHAMSVVTSTATEGGIGGQDAPGTKTEQAPI